MQELNMVEVDEVGGAVSWDQFSAGVAVIALGFAILAFPPVGALAATTATSLSATGGLIIGNALSK